MKLYDLSWGPWTRRVTIYLKEKNITDFEVIALFYGDGCTRLFTARSL